MAKAYASTVVNASADRVWDRIRDFNGLSTWHSSFIANSVLREGQQGDQVGASRTLTLANGVEVFEQMTAHSDEERSYTYVFEDPAPFDVDNYCATVRVTPITDGGGSFVEWWTTFDCDRDQQEHWVAFFPTEVFQGGFDALKAHFES